MYVVFIAEGWAWCPSSLASWSSGWVLGVHLHWGPVESLVSLPRELSSLTSAVYPHVWQWEQPLATSQLSRYCFQSHEVWLFSPWWLSVIYKL